MIHQEVLCKDNDTALFKFSNEWYLENDIIEFLQQNLENLEVTEGSQQIPDFTFFVDLLGYLNKLNSSITSRKYISWPRMGSKTTVTFAFNADITKRRKCEFL